MGQLFRVIQFNTLFYIALSLLIAVIANTLLRWVIKLPKHLDNKQSRTFISILHNILTVLIYSITLYVILTILGINITPLLASAGIVGLAIGFGAKSLVEDLISGAFLLSQKAIAIGDYVKIDSESEGYVQSIGLRTLTIRDLNGAYHIIPNGIIKKVINYSQKEMSVIIDIPVKGNQLSSKVEKALSQALTDIQTQAEYKEYVLPGSMVKGIEDIIIGNVLIYRIHIVTRYYKRWIIAREYRSLVKKAFEKNKIVFG